MGKWRGGNAHIDGLSDDNKRRAFLIRKYVNREWFSETAQKPLVAAGPRRANARLPSQEAPQPVVDDLIDLSSEPTRPAVPEQKRTPLDDLIAMVMQTPPAPVAETQMAPSLRQILSSY
jgi:hypothetical protein